MAKNQPMAERITLPPKWCSAICTNAMNQVCIEACAIKRDTSGFREKQGLKLADMPPMPKIEDLQTREEKFAALYIYTSKLVEEAQGEDNGYLPPIPVRRPYPHTKTSSPVPSSVPIQSVLHDLAPTASTSTDREEEREDIGVTTESVATSAD